ncbi:hypothetical protein J6590_013869 [Homalodisca vitripennis]|nr:hypothetical protein J6590_013869 [Homalodisca vitripennis]
MNAGDVRSGCGCYYVSAVTWKEQVKPNIVRACAAGVPSPQHTIAKPAATLTWPIVTHHTAHYTSLRAMDSTLLLTQS